MLKPYTIRLFGALRVERGGESFSRFRSHKTGALLAYLAFYRDQAHPRFSLMAQIWGQEPEEQARHKLRVALSSLRQSLTLKDAPDYPVLFTDRYAVQINPEIIETDTAQFEALLHQAATAPSPDEKRKCLKFALSFYQPELLAGFYENWILPEQLRLNALYLNATHQLQELWIAESNWDLAIESALQAVTLEPYHEENHLLLMRYYVATNQPASALRQYQQMKHLFQQELNTKPSHAVQQLADQIESRLQQPFPRSMMFSETDSPPSLKGVPSLKSNLPVPVSRFFGRIDEMKALSELLIGRASNQTPQRLVTMTGPGGSGKTRLALETARRLQTRYGEAIWFLSLQDLTSPEHIPQEIRQTFRLRGASEELFEELSRLIGSQPALLIVDNVEHLLPEGASVIKQMLQRVPNLQVLVTSRVTLNVDGEVEFFVEPLPLPDAEVDRAQRFQFPSLQLFEDRARLVQPSFSLTVENLETVTDICARLDGLPLAIELAAARIRVASLESMQQHLNHRLEFIVSRRTDLPKRHQSLRAAIDWSWQILSEPLQLFWASLTVFPGSWTVEAASQVFGAPDTMTMLEELMTASLIVSVEQAGERRFRMLETLREFASEQLSSDQRAIFRARHAAYYVDLAERLQHAAPGQNSPEWIRHWRREMDNLEAVFQWLGETKSAEPCFRLIYALAGFYGQRFRYAAWNAFEQVYPLRDQVSSSIVARALMSLRSHSAHFSEPILRPYYEEAIQRCRDLDDEWGLAWSLLNLGSEFDHDAEPLLQEALRLFRRLGDLPGLTRALSSLGRFYLEVQRDISDKTRARLEESLQIAEAIGDHDAAYQARNPLVDLEILSGRQERAWDICQENLRRVMELEDQAPYARRLLQLAPASEAFKPLSETRKLYEEAARVLRHIGDGYNLCTCLYELSEILLLLDDKEAAQQAIQEGLNYCSPEYVPYTFIALRSQQALLAMEAGDHAFALKIFHENVALKQAPHENTLLGAAYTQLGDEIQAQYWLESALQATQNNPALHDGYIFSRLYLGRLDIVRNRLASAREHLRAAYDWYHQRRERRKLLIVLESLSELAVKERDEIEAARCQQEYDSLRAALGMA